MTDESGETQQEDWGRERKEAASTCELGPHSLVGSWFHKLESDHIVWQGIVVGEPGQGVYLLEIDDSVPGVKSMQRLVSIKQMVEAEGEEWRFYDTDESMRLGFAQWELRPERDNA